MKAARRLWHAWLVGAVALLVWSQGAWDWLMMTTRNPDYLADVPQDWQALVFGQPVWVSIVWAIAVWGLFIGAVGLVFGRTWAVLPLVAAAIGLTLDQVYVYVLHPEAAAWRADGVTFSVVLCCVFAAFAIYAAVMAKRGVLR